VGNEGWLEHRTQSIVHPGTVLQPYYNRTKTVTSPEMKDITNARTSRYCLITQEADTEGELETKLYKGDVIQTTSGGAQVVFDDVECLKQKSPSSSPTRHNKRKSATTTPKKKSQSNTDVVSSRCSQGIEGHYTKKQRI
jgi:kinesin family protein 23